MDARLLARALAAARIVIGVGLFAAPRTAARAWLGQPASTPTAVLARGLGARDLVLGVGQLVALDDPASDPSTWLDAAVAADTADAAAALLARRDLDGTRVAGTVVVALGAAAAGLLLKRELAAPAS